MAPPVVAPMALVAGECIDPTQLSPDCQVSGDVTVTLRGLVLPSDPAAGGPFVLLEFNPFGRPVRAETETPRAWADGAWSGGEWNDAATIPLTVLVRAPNLQAARGTRFWLPHHQALAAAFAASADDVALEFTIANPDRPVGGDTFLVYGRPRLLDPAASTALRGWALARCAFRVLDPLVYSGGPDGLRQAQTGLPTQTGGLCTPVGAPLEVNATVVAGRVAVTSCGTAPTALELRIDGPCTEPRVSLVVAGQPTQVLRYHGALAAGQWLELNTRARTALLNGTVSRRGLMSGDWFLLPPGPSELAFDAADYHPDAELTATWRDAWLA
jgi:Siphovirus-type tail component, C-terminal domain